MSRAAPSLVIPQTTHSGAHFGGVYLDYNATTPIDPRVIETMTEFLGSRFGNASSPHTRGRAAEAAVERAAEELAEFAGCRATEITWTSGSTEAINTVIKGLSLSPANRRRTIVASAAEHKAVLDSLAWVEAALGVRVLKAPARGSGAADLDRLEELVDDDTFLVIAMGANNETGALTDMSAAAEIARDAGALYLCDATQLAGKAPLDIEAVGADYVSLSAHKMYGPQGIGALIATRDAREALVPLIHGGGHQGGIRSGTLNLPGIVGFGTAASLARRSMDAGEPSRLGRLRDAFEADLEDRTSDMVVHAKESSRLPNTSSLRFSGVDGEALVMALRDLAIATGSACTSAVPTPSHVLTAMGLSEEHATETVRVSIGRYTKEDDLSIAVDRIVDEVTRIRELSA